MILNAIILFISAVLGGLSIYVFGSDKINIKNLLIFAGAYLFSITVIHILPELFHADADGFQVGLAVLSGFFFHAHAVARTAWIPDCRGTIVLDCGEKHVLQLFFILWRHNYHIWNKAKEREIKNSVVAWSVVPSHTSSVNCESHRQIWQAYVVYYLVKCPLEES